MSVASRLALGLALAAGSALALHASGQPAPGPELQEHFPRNAVVAFVQRDWRPFGLLHGAALFDALRALFTLGYGVARFTGAAHDRIDVLAAFIRDPFPFVLAGRALVAAAAIGGLVTVAAVARRLGGAGAATAAALLCGTMMVWVREAHHVWLDLPAGAAAILTAWLALRLLHRPTIRGAALLGAAAGLTVATKHSALPIVATVACAAVLAPAQGAARRLAAAGGALAAVFLALSPYLLLDARGTIEMLRAQSAVTYRLGRPGLPLAQLLDLGIGWPACLLAAAGLAATARAQPRAAAVVAAFPALYLVLLLPARMTFLRYLAPLAPFVAAFAGAGAAAARRIVPRRAESAAVLLAFAAAMPQGLESLAHVRLLARDDTRVAVGYWLREHVPPGTAIAVPNLTGYPNPALPADGGRIALVYPAFASELARRGVPDPAATYPLRYLGFFDTLTPLPVPLPPFVVTVRHPTILTGMNTPARTIAELERVGARPVAAFVGVGAGEPAGTHWDFLDADYPPIRGATALVAPGPDLTVWQTGTPP